ncbi:MAG: GTPase Era [Defluviitaleaceae bacterium]|nr:GTPase Era [Defluviitaleaceae bacterium]
MEFKSGFVTIIGRPNVGKSTLVNSLVGEKLTITSSKAQTTRNQIRCIINTENSQIVLIDTPGIVDKVENKLGNFMDKYSKIDVNSIDITLFVIEPDKTIGKMDKEIIKRLQGDVFLIINKIDKIAKEEVLQVIDIYKNTYPFKEILPISALKNETYNLVDLIENYLQDGPKYFSDNMITDQPERQIAAEFIREKLLRNLEEEIPHGVAVEILKMKKRDNKNLVDIDATIYCEQDSHKGIIIGKNGDLIKKIGTEARRDIENLLGSKIFLQTKVKTKKNWRNNDIILKNLGYADNLN